MKAIRLLEIYLENCSELAPIFQFTPDLLDRALGRCPTLAPQLKITIASDKDDRAELRTASVFGAGRFKTADFMKRAPNVSYVQVFAAGIDAMVPLDWIPDKVKLASIAGAHGAKPRQSILMAILMAHSRLPALITAQRERRWDRIFTSTPDGGTIVIVGVGNIGGAAAEEANRLGMTVIGIRRSGEAHPHVHHMFTPDQLDVVLPRADIVLLTSPLTPSTQGMMDARRFALMRRGAALINFGRGGLVDEPALIETLRLRHLSGAVLDVASREPLPPEAALWDAPNLILTPHVLADDTANFMDRALDIFFENIQRHLKGEKLRNEVNRSWCY